MFIHPFGSRFYSLDGYMSDPSSNYGGFKTAAVGANNQAAQSMLKQDNKDATN